MNRNILDIYGAYKNDQQENSKLIKFISRHILFFVCRIKASETSDKRKKDYK